MARLALSRRDLLIALGGLILFAAIGAFMLTRDQGYDRAYDARVEAPTYAGEHPLVLFDEAHGQEQFSDHAFRPFVRLLESDGYRVEANEETLSAERLASVHALVIVGGAAADALSEAEASVVTEWVLRGGSLLLVAEGEGAHALAERFGVEFSDAAADEPEHVFTGAALGAHAITAAPQRADPVVTFGARAIRGPADAAQLLRLVGVNGWTQGLAIRFGRGRLVILADEDMLRAYLDEAGAPIGMNRPGAANRQFVLNVMHWLTHLF